MATTALRRMVPVDEVELWTIDELAAAAKESRSTIKRRIRCGQVPALHLSKRTVRIRAGDAIQYLRTGGCEANSIEASNVHQIHPT